MRAALLESTLDVAGLIVLLAWTAVATVAAVKWFKWN